VWIFTPALADYPSVLPDSSSTDTPRNARTPGPRRIGYSFSSPTVRNARATRSAPSSRPRGCLPRARGAGAPAPRNGRTRKDSALGTDSQAAAESGRAENRRSGEPCAVPHLRPAANEKCLRIGMCRSREQTHRRRLLDYAAAYMTNTRPQGARSHRDHGRPRPRHGGSRLQGVNESRICC